MRTIVVVNDRLAYAGGLVLAGFASCPPGGRRVVTDALVARHRDAGWRVVDRRRDAASVA